MAWDKGFDFRATSGYIVVEPTDCTYVLTSDTYTGSVIRNGVAFGYTVAGFIDSRNRSLLVDPRLAGIHFVSAGGTPAVFRIDLPSAGVYDIYAAFGDATSQQTIKLTITDNGAAVITITNSGTGGANEYRDASNANRTEAQWVADSARGGTAVQATFSTTTLLLNVLDPTSESTCIAHIFIHQVSVSSDDLMGQMVM